jgi:hypothetical protein
MNTPSMAGVAAGTWASRHRMSSRFVKCFALRPVPAYGHRYALVLLVSSIMATAWAQQTGQVEQHQSHDTSSLMVEGLMTIGNRGAVLLAMLVLTFGVSGCQRENPVEKSQAPQPSPSVVDQAVRQSVDVIQTPMDKARSVEGTLNEAASRTADQAQESTQ